MIRSIASAARAASPPLSSSLSRARAQACASVLTVMMPLPSGKARSTGNLHQRARGFHRHDLEMNGVAADHAAQRNRRIVSLAVVLGGIERHHDRRRNFQRAGHGDDFMGHALALLDLGHRAFQQRILDIVIEARLDDQRCARRRCRSGLSVLRGGRLPLVQSVTHCRRVEPASSKSRCASSFRSDAISDQACDMTTFRALTAATSFRSAAPHSAPSDRLRD